MSEPWNEGVRGTEVLPLINSDDRVIRVEAGPGTGKTFGLSRRVVRVMHPDGLAVDGREVLVVAFNRVIAKDLRESIERELAKCGIEGKPVIRTVHALCLEVIGTRLRILMEHEREAMLYDVLERHEKLQDKYENTRQSEQALSAHEAKLEEHPALWKAVSEWLTRHAALLISDLPGKLLDSMKGGDYRRHRYQHVLVDEFQDLTKGEQQLFVQLRTDDGSLVALGDRRQSIYRFRGNDRKGLANLESLSGEGVSDVEMRECMRCPKDTVEAANKLMELYDAADMQPGRDEESKTHLVDWATPAREAEGMAAVIVENVRARPDDEHLVMVTRRKFAFQLRDEILKLDPKFPLDVCLSESLLETWAVREAFLLFCLLADADAPTWRAWLGYQNSEDGKNWKAPKRNAGAYLRFLDLCEDSITAEDVERLAEEERGERRGAGGTKLWDRAARFVEVRDEVAWSTEDAVEAVRAVFDEQLWVTDEMEDQEAARHDFERVCEKAEAMLEEFREKDGGADDEELLRRLAERLRYMIATREPFVPDDGDGGEATKKVKVATLWGAKGVTADHVYVLGVCNEAVPGKRRQEYAGTEAQYVDEQRRLFYVSLTRSKETLVLSRALSIRRGEAERLQLGVTSGSKYWADLHVSDFVREILSELPASVEGEEWGGLT